MRKVSTLVGLTLVALAATARAQESTPAAAPAPERISRFRGRAQVGVSFLPMALGKFTAVAGGERSTTDIAGTFGAGLSFGYTLRPGLSVGIAPQAIFNLTLKDDSATSQVSLKEYDLMARVAYAHPVTSSIAVYAEMLPGYSLIVPSAGDTSKGPVLGFGAGLAIDLMGQTFATLGAGYQIGFQQRSGKGLETGDVKTSFVRVALSLGVRL